MRRTLFTIDHDIAGLPLLGFGWIFALLVAAAVVYVALALRRPQLRAELPQRAVGWAIAVVVVVFVGPAIELRSVTGEPLGLAIRGYGVMLLAGVTSGVALALYRARRAGIAVDHIYAMALWLLIGGLVGARAFYVLQYPERVLQESLGESVQAIINFTGGGLVVYGAIIGGFLAGVAYCLRQRLSPLRVGDVVIPSLFIGLFFGRIGCLLNGCCYGGRCEEGIWALHFPPGSPVYEEQLASGELVGLRLTTGAAAKQQAVRLPAEIASVRPGSPADRRGIEAGQTVRLLTTVAPPKSASDRDRPATDTSRLGVTAVVDGREHYWPAESLPPRSLAVRPAQLISSLSGLVVAGLLLAISPFLRRDGMLLAIGLGGYAVGRFGLEMLRSDEPGRFGTALTISQWVSVFVFLAACGLMAFILLRSTPARAPAKHAPG